MNKLIVALESEIKANGYKGLASFIAICQEAEVTHGENWGIDTDIMAAKFEVDRFEVREQLMRDFDHGHVFESEDGQFIYDFP